MERQASTQAPVLEAADPETGDPEVTKGKILIVEDERPLILLVRRILTKAGFEIVGEVSVDAGLQRLASEAFDLVLLDYKMPDKPGTEMVRVLGNRLETLPVIMLTGFTDVRLAVEVMKAGVADYVVKDARLEFIQSLPKKIEDVLERFKLRRENAELQRRLQGAERGLESAAEHAARLGNLASKLRSSCTEMLTTLTDSTEDRRARAQAAEQCAALIAHLDEMLRDSAQ